MRFQASLPVLCGIGPATAPRPTVVPRPAGTRSSLTDGVAHSTVFAVGLDSLLQRACQTSSSPYSWSRIHG
ncbi:hypothetical protein AK973_3373 [Pseudomonas brassicacearum]|nr:hypothetical protein AK973_3373 [Pseudomonas brassicacearum]